MVRWLLLTGLAVMLSCSQGGVQGFVLEGEDYSLPAWVTVDPYSGYGSQPDGQRILLKNWGVGWKELEPQRGKYNWALVDEEFRKAKEGKYKLLMRLTNISHGAVWAKPGIGVGHVVPDWVIKNLRVPVDSLGSRNGSFAFNLNTIPGWHPEVQKAFNAFVREFGKRGYPQRDELAGAYIHGISISRGEEFFMGPEEAARLEKTLKLSPEALRSWIKNKIDAFAEAFQGVEYKLSWVGHENAFDFGAYAGIGKELLDYALAKGAGTRGGGVEWYYRSRASSSFGSYTDDQGYMYIDEANPVQATARYYGEENEEYGKGWEWRWGPYEMHPYRYRMAMMHTLALRFRFIWTSGEAEKMNPQLSEYGRYSFGKNIQTTPDAWAYLWEGYENPDGSKRVRNCERWLMQRDVPGGVTQPANRVERQYNPGGPREITFDFASRRTDLASDNAAVYFDLDDRFAVNDTVDIKVEVLCNSDAAWRLEYTGEGGAVRKSASVKLPVDGAIRTVTFALGDAQFANALDYNMDFRIVCDGPEDLTVQWVRVVRRQLP